MTSEDPVRAIGRDADVLERFYREHLEAVQLFVARRVSAPQDAADLTAEVFLAAISASSRYRGEAAAPRAWLFGIARRVVTGHFRANARAVRATERLAAQPVLDDDAIERISARIDGEREARRLWQTISALPATQRAVVELVAVDGLSLADAASVLGISPVNARVRYHRARARLGVSLTPCEVPR